MKEVIMQVPAYFSDYPKVPICLDCLHLWRSTIEKLPTPPSILTGIKDITFEDLKKLKKMQRSVDCSWTLPE